MAGDVVRCRTRGSRRLGWVSSVRATTSAGPRVAAAPQPRQQQQQPPEQARQTTRGAWERLPQMQLEQMFGGPLQDTVVQRWRDPQTGTLCYLYLPFTVQHSATTPLGSVQYGANTIGSISCLESTSAPRVAGPSPPSAAAAKKPPAHAPARATGEPAGQQ